MRLSSIRSIGSLLAGFGSHARGAWPPGRASRLKRSLRRCMRLEPCWVVGQHPCDAENPHMS
jgi:hypothetical protein